MSELHIHTLPADVARMVAETVKQMERERDEARAEVDRLREALDNSQSLFVALLLIGPDRQGWKTEPFERLIEQQASENRTAPTPPS